MAPFFSVVIPLYNKEHFIEATLKSVIAQTFEDFEIVIIDDGSTDSSINIIAEIKDSRIKIITQKNLGASYARNNGIEQSKGEYIAFLDADDLWKKNHLDILFNLIKDFPESNIYCTGYNIRFSEKLIKRRKVNDLNHEFRGQISDYFFHAFSNTILMTGNNAIPRKLFDTIGLFDVNMKSGQDTDMWIRLALNYNIALDSVTTLTYLKNNNSLSNSMAVKDRILLFNKFEKQEKTNKTLKKYIDLNRYAVALNSKMNKDNHIYKTLKKEIDFNNLNIKQKMLLNLPATLLVFIKKIQGFLIKRNIYITSYS